MLPENNSMTPHKALETYDHERFGPILGVSDEGSAVPTIVRAAYACAKAKVVNPGPMSVGVIVDGERMGSAGEVPIGPDEYLEQIRRVKEAGVRTRLDTNGHADLIHKRAVAPELVGLIDVVSVSLNAQDRETFERHCPSAFSPDGFTPMLEWIRAASEAGLDVVCTALEGLDGVDVEACRRLAESLGARWRDRVLNAVG